MTAQSDNLPRLYFDLADWWDLVSPPEDYAREADHHWRLITEYARRPIQTMLELGCGGGNNAVHLKQRCRLTLCDISPPMLAIARRRNPDCEFVQDDMRSLRLCVPGNTPRSFDAVLVHDGIMHMTTEGDLRRVMQTAYEHCASGGVALMIPDCVRETWSPATGHGGHDGDDGRAIRFLDWTWDPDPLDTEYIVDIAYLLREAGGSVRIERDRHRFGLFATTTWLQLLTDVGFQAAVEPCGYPDAEAARSFIGVRTA